MNKVKVQELEKVFEPLFYYWKQKRQTKDESFGDFTNRMVSTKLTDILNFLILVALVKTACHVSYIFFITLKTFYPSVD